MCTTQAKLTWSAIQGPHRKPQKVRNVNTTRTSGILIKTGKRETHGLEHEQDPLRSGFVKLLLKYISCSGEKERDDQHQVHLFYCERSGAFNPQVSSALKRPGGEYCSRLDAEGFKLNSWHSQVGLLDRPPGETLENSCQAVPG